MIGRLFDHYFMNNISGNGMKLSRLREVLSGDETALLTHKSTPSSLLSQISLLQTTVQQKCSTDTLHLFWHKWEKTVLRTRLGCNFLMQIQTPVIASLQVKIQILYIKASTKIHKNDWFGFLIFVFSFVLHVIISFQFIS